MFSRTAATPRPRWLAAPLGALALVLAFPATALAAPPPGLPANADSLELRYQPAYDYDTDGCYPTPAIGTDGAVNGGLNPTGALNGNCRDASDLDNTNGYARARCDGDWCAYMYGLYFEKDQALPGTSLGGHRHDWEHVVVWVKDDAVRYVSTSNHGSFSVHERSAVRFDDTHPKIVYHKDGISTHCFRLATSNDEPPENHEGTWQYPPLVGWNGYPAGLREKLTAHDFGSANFGLKDASFASHLAAARPAGVPFDPNA
ncbi:NPP1 family protein [Streptomyces ardesiacus]|uniref:NPP1 family protein n=1 Tax=Streptomyces ardesiacus TaxID=285564 RepID=UPI000A99D597|nr:NPP1 family protein [Streptomyces ardesiacus]MCL7369498.1 NPP1 family protein [Streptomyces ardesiacus]